MFSFKSSENSFMLVTRVMGEMGRDRQRKKERLRGKERKKTVEVQDADLLFCFVSFYDCTFSICKFPG